MEFDQLEEGDKIKVNDKIYEVIKVEEQVDIVKPLKYKVRMFTVFYLFD
mgnify:CR=1 FL=1